MTAGAAPARPPPASDSWRLGILGAALVVLVLVLVPPIGPLARRRELWEALQFSLLAVGVPALVAVGAPWHRLGLARAAGRPADRVGATVRDGDGPTPPGPVDRLAAGRRRHPDLVRALAFVGVDLAVIVLWHTPGAVDAVASPRWLVLAEALCLVVAGVGLWSEIVVSPPLRPRLAPPWRAVLAAVSMWTIWTMAYVVGLSTTSWYRPFGHLGGHGLRAPADQQFAIVVLWAVAAVAFAPVVFWDALEWLRSDEDPDRELRRLVSAERRRGWASPRPLGPGGDTPPPP